MIMLKAMSCVLALLALSGCVSHYTRVSDQVAVAYTASTPVRYKVYDRVRMSGDGPMAVSTALQQHAFFREAIQSYDIGISSEGVFVEVTPTYQEPSFMAILFGYFSMSTLTILPAFSNEDGFDLRFDVYREGKMIFSRKYETRRFMMLWAGTLPFLWLNEFTASEEEAFAAVTQQFLMDAQAVLAKSE